MTSNFWATLMAVLIGFMVISFVIISGILFILFAPLPLSLFGGLFILIGIAMAGLGITTLLEERRNGW